MSAKFKGAFCEAKIKKIDRNVRCKLTFKNSNESQTLNENQILCHDGQQIPVLKLNSIVYAMSSGVLKPATLVKIIDQSVYTVVFNDGDVKTLRRSFIRFKGEKHFLDSETLNNAPLNNPEHFLFPIKNKNSPLNDSKQSTGNSDDDENASDMLSSSQTSRTRSKSRKAQEEIQITKEKIYVADKNGSDNDSQSDVDKSQIEANEDDEEGEYSENSSDDYPSEEKDRFVAQLYKFMDDRGTSLNKIPSVNKVDLDLHKFFIVVRKFGGFNKVTKQKLWLDVYKRLGLSEPSSANVISLKCSYKRYLQPYEDFYRKLGSTVCDLVSLRQTSSGSISRRLSSTDSHRQFFKQRYLGTPSSTTNSGQISSSTNAALGSRNRGGAASVNTNLSSSKASKQKSSQNNNDDNKSTAWLNPNELAQSNDHEDLTLLKRSHSLNENKDLLTLESLASNNMITSNESNDEQSSQHQEEITLSSIAKNLNENFKKAKKESSFSHSCENNVKKNDAALSSTNKDKSNKDISINKSNTTVNMTTATLTNTTSPSGSQKTKLKGRRFSAENKPNQTTNKKSKSDTNQLLIDKNSDDYDGEDEEDEPKGNNNGKRNKTHRTSINGSEESYSSTVNTKGLKRKNSLNSSKNSNNQKDDDENNESSLNDTSDE